MEIVPTYSTEQILALEAKIFSTTLNSNPIINLIDQNIYLVKIEEANVNHYCINCISKKVPLIMQFTSCNFNQSSIKLYTHNTNKRPSTNQFIETFKISEQNKIKLNIYCGEKNKVKFTIPHIYISMEAEKESEFQLIIGFGSLHYLGKSINSNRGSTELLRKDLLARTENQMSSLSSEKNHGFDFANYLREPKTSRKSHSIMRKRISLEIRNHINQNLDIRKRNDQLAPPKTEENLRVFLISRERNRQIDEMRIKAAKIQREILLKNKIVSRIAKIHRWDLRKKKVSNNISKK